MTTAQIILEQQQLGGNKFIAMTGSNHFLDDGSTLHMHLAKNASNANRLSITLNADDTYTMKFWKYTAPRLNRKTFSYSREKIVDIKTICGIYFDQMQNIFTNVTHLYTSL